MLASLLYKTYHNSGTGVIRNIGNGKSHSHDFRANLGKKFWDISDFKKVESRLGKRFLLKNIQTKINVQEFFFDDSYSEQAKDFWQMVGKFIPNSHEKFQICQFEHIKAAL